MFEKTGKKLDHWIDVVKKTKIEKHGEIIKHLKEKYDFTHGFANFVAHKARQSDAGSQDDDLLMEMQYKGKEVLIPIYDRLVHIIESLGMDITKTPKKDSVSFIRKHQFALVKPATKTRVDLGLKIKGQDPEGKLENSGPFGAMCTHRIQLHSPADIDKEVERWIKTAYDLSV